jgi:hypothetical protein
MTRATFATVVVGLVFSLGLTACNKESSSAGGGSSSSSGGGGGGGGSEAAKYPGTEEGARQLLTDIRKEGAAAEMTAKLKPTSADYKAVFEGDAAAKAEKGYEALWGGQKALVITADPANTELKLFKATTDDLKAGTSEAVSEFPGGYKQIAGQFKPGLTMYRWKYTKPGDSLGMAYDGLVYVNGHWAWFPKPWRVLGGE